MSKSGCLYIVATPIGNLQDITLRAIETLKSVDAIVCEERKEGSKLLKRLNIKANELIPLNEHNERGKSERVSEIMMLLHQGKNLALISDCGTPVFSDPGAVLIQQAVSFNIPVIPVPGPSSLMATLSILDENLDRFVFGGFLPRQSDKRLQELKNLDKSGYPIVLMDTPYRLNRLLDEIATAFGKGRRITLACDLTLPTESIFRGSVKEIQKKVAGRKAEFVLIVHASRRGS
ncbi:MAG: 16S rRNA (cytidine(1402)-2'-O)-methyltransferase [Anaerolineaceae bacterium]|nr:16S rRNA (cytidine(1402)-2'-O)-methyltransferase [Anaerolineaceae bacterium]